MSTTRVSQPITRQCRTCADLTVRGVIAIQIEQYGADSSDWLEQTRLTLSQVLGRQLDSNWLEDVVTGMDDAMMAADGIHPDLRMNAARTVNNQPELMEHCDGELTIRLNRLLDAAGFPDGWANGTGTTAKPTTNHLKAAA